MRGTKAAVSQCLLQQIGTAKRVTGIVREGWMRHCLRIKRRVQARQKPAAELGAKSINRLMFLNNGTLT